MGDRTAISWTDATWNPTRGCSRVSEGCRHCYAEGVAARFSDPGAAYDGLADRTRTGSKWTGRVDVAWHLVEQPLAWQRPRRIFVNSMSDLFHETLPQDTIATIFAVMVAAVHLRGHTFQVLTKRSARMRAILMDAVFWDQVNAEAEMHVLERCDPLSRRRDDARATLGAYSATEPPPGIWLGVSVEDQSAAYGRVPYLIATPAVVRFLSCEPLIGHVNLSPWLHPGGGLGLHWVIVGGESGVGARPMDPAWARSLREQCHDAGVAFFFKQWGGRTASSGGDLLDGYQHHAWPGGVPTDVRAGDPACDQEENARV